MEYSFRAYCDICNEPSKWFRVAYQARGWREIHFESEHPDNPMKKQNCRIQRDTVKIQGDENEWHNYDRNND